MTADLTTSYLGLRLPSPIVASASPLTGRIDLLHQIEDAGAGAVVLPSLFEEQLRSDALAVARQLMLGSDTGPEADGYLPDLDGYNLGPQPYLDLIEDARAALAIPVIASLNGSSPGGWSRYARLMEEAGAAAIEVNTYGVGADPWVSGAEIEDRLVDLVASVCATVHIPVAVKLSPFYSSLAHLVRRLAGAGPSGFVLFNRFMQPDLDIDEIAVVPEIHLSAPAELLLPLRWIAILRGQVDVSLAGTSGVHSARDAVKLLLAGADVVMTASGLLRDGPRHVADLIEGIGAWLDRHAYGAIDEMRGALSQQNSPEPAAYERTQYMRAITGFRPLWLR